MAQNEELESSNPTDKVFILASELLWPKWLQEKYLWKYSGDLDAKVYVNLPS
jgi:hypothetical protein